MTKSNGPTICERYTEIFPLDTRCCGYGKMFDGGIIIPVRWKRRSGRALGISLTHSAQGQYDMAIPEHNQVGTMGYIQLRPQTIMTEIK